MMGFDVRRRPKEAKRRIGYVPQEIRLHLDQTVEETALFYSALRGVPAERALGLLADWGLLSAKTKPAQNLSGGMKQKLALVIALLSDPPVLLLDEPTSSLDAAARREFRAALDRLKSAGKTLLFCSHRVAEARRIAGRVVVLEAGVKTADGEPGAVLEKLR